MRLHAIALALLPIFFFIVKADALANATASPPPLETTSSTEARAGTFISEPPYAEDEERVENGLGNEFIVLLAKALWKQDAKSRLELKLAYWRLNDVGPHFVYSWLNLGKVDQDVLAHPRFQGWVEYVERYNLAHPASKVSIFEKLLERFGDYKLAMMLEEATREADITLNTMGTELQLQHMLYWKERDIGPRQLHEILQANSEHPTLLMGREYDIWNTYFSKFMPGESMGLFDQLYHTFGDEDLPLLLISASKSEDVEVAGLAKELQFQLADFWLSKDQLPNFVFEHLMLHKHPRHLLDQHEVKVWLYYAIFYRAKEKKAITFQDFIKAYYNKYQIESIVNEARTHYGKKLAKALALELL